jgi:hypothetical protein
MKKLITFLLIIISLNSFGQKTLHIYGGKDHDVYLGCINCSDIDQNSIWNEIGKYGSNVSPSSIWNDISTYGSDISQYSPWNDLASYPPVIVDRDGGFYGYLTTNSINYKRADFDLALTLYKFHDIIKDNVSKWYNKIFR